RERNALLHSCVGTWAGSEPEKAIAMVESWPAEITNDSNKELSFNSIARAWVWKNRDAALEWIEGQEAGPAKDSSLAGAVNGMYPGDPKEALELSGRIG